MEPDLLFALFALFCFWGLTPVCQAAPASEPKVAVAVVKNGETFIVDATLDVAVPPAVVWGVLTDFDHMTSIVSNLTYSRVMSREGNTWVVQQKGAARFGLLSFPFESEREIKLEPMRRVLAKNLSGTLKRMESEAQLIPTSAGTQVKYHAEVVPDSLLVELFGASFMRHEFEEQFSAMGREMLKR